VAALRERVAPALLVSELRTIAADDLWLSPAYRRDSLGLHSTWRPEPRTVLPLVAAVEDALAPYDARPHWGKVFAAGELTDRYPRAHDFRALRDELDPDDVFGNDFLGAHLPR
jgi:xylitol oxidase